MSLSDINPQIDPGSDATQEGVKTTGITPEDVRKTGASLQETVINNASAAVDAVKNHPITQNITEGPVAQSVKKEAEQTTHEFGGLASSRTKPKETAVTGQSLTHYHSFFYTLLSWEHPRATAITFVASVLFIFACRYLPVLKWVLKLSWMVLGVVTLTEVAAKYVLGGSVTSSVRPRRYYKIPKESLEASLDDLEQLINFFVIELQRVIFAENVLVTAGAFVSALVSYFLIKILPFWGLTLLGTFIIYLGPLVYIQNKELIDGQIEHASKVIGQQTAQVRDLTAEHAGKSLETIKSYTSDYTAKASELVGTARAKIPLTTGTTAETTPNNTVRAADFPAAPQTNLSSAAEHTKPLVNAPTEDAPIAASAS